MKDRKNQISVIGAGPVGSLLSIYLSQQGYKTEVFEKRPDPRQSLKAEGRSINIALSHRGIRALNEIGLEEDIRKIAIPMKGRMIHLENGALNFQPYGKEGQMIYSVSRNELNRLLIEKAEKAHRVDFHFQTHCDHVDTGNSTLHLSAAGEKFAIQSEVIFGTDGAFSAVRKSFSGHSGFRFEQETLSHAYKELHMPEGAQGRHLMEPNALHIWPREQFMLIALPNTDGSFTCTLFLPAQGANSFESIRSREELSLFFQKYFKDAIPLMPDYQEDYFRHDPSPLITVHCYPWFYDHALLMGDAAHAITPFYGQGMNAGFEDCRIFNRILGEEQDWESRFKKFQAQRKENGDAIGELALQNFVEMRDLVADRTFQLRKKIEAEIHAKDPSYLPLYTMVTFSDLPYKEALLKGKEHDRMMAEVMSIPDIENIFKTEDGWLVIQKIMKRYNA